ncbi:hypothetical protein [Streptomyces mirabilis]|uniref:hypothetical protein n=1 Tax=Streptomyces mirabilis TaxID=68239 RepID=UPI0036A20C0B
MRLDVGASDFGLPGCFGSSPGMAEMGCDGLEDVLCLRQLSRGGFDGYMSAARRAVVIRVRLAADVSRVRLVVRAPHVAGLRHIDGVIDHVRHRGQADDEGEAVPVLWRAGRMRHGLGM